jgi:hypothetical protein
VRKPLSYAALPLVAAGGFVVGLFAAACMPWREFTASAVSSPPSAATAPRPGDEINAGNTSLYQLAARMSEPGSGG